MVSFRKSKLRKGNWTTAGDIPEPTLTLECCSALRLVTGMFFGAGRCLLSAQKSTATCAISRLKLVEQLQ